MQGAVDARDPELLRILTHVSSRRRARAASDVGLLERASVSRSVVDSQSTVPMSAPAPSERAAAPSGAPGTLLDIHRVTDAVRILRIGRPAGFAFVPGQHVKLGIPGAGQNPYTIASAPDEPFLEFCIEQAPNGRVTPRLFALRPGDRVQLGALAKGRFTLVANARVQLMVATVTGITPFLSMLRHAERRNAWPGTFVVLHGASFAGELAYRAELESLAARSAGRVRYLPSVSRPAEPGNRGWQGDTGRVTELVASAIATLGSTTGLQVYACGNPDMVATVRAQMESQRIPVATEAFD